MKVQYYCNQNVDLAIPVVFLSYFLGTSEGLRTYKTSQFGNCKLKLKHCLYYTSLYSLHIQKVPLKCSSILNDYKVQYYCNQMWIWLYHE